MPVADWTPGGRDPAELDHQTDRQDGRPRGEKILPAARPAYSDQKRSEMKAMCFTVLAWAVAAINRAQTRQRWAGKPNISFWVPSQSQQLFYLFFFVFQDFQTSKKTTVSLPKQEKV